MAACTLFLRLPKLRYVPCLRKARSVYNKPENEIVEQDGKRATLKHRETSSQGDNRLCSNPSLYLHPVRSSRTFQSHIADDDDESYTPQYQSNSKNTQPVPTDVKMQTRAFTRSRMEYASITLDLNERPPPIGWEQAEMWLQKVPVLKNTMKASDVCLILAELSCCDPDKLLLLKTDQRFITLIRYCFENLRRFTEIQLLDVLQSFVWLQLPSDHFILNVHENEISQRVNCMSLHQLLLAADLWRCIGRRVPQFLKHLYDSVNLYWENMGVSEFVHFLYIMGEGRHCPTDLIAPVEKVLMHHLEKLKPEEVGAICIGLFKSKSSLSMDAVTRLVDKAHSFVEEMSDFAMVNVLKYLRFTYLYHNDWMNAMMQEVPRRAQKMDVKGLMHVVLTCSALHYRNEHILRAVADNMMPLVPLCRSKDAGKLLWSFGTVRFIPPNPNFYASLTDALRQRKDEFEQYPEHLLTGLLGLAFVSQFPEDLIALALSPAFVSLALNCAKLDLRKDFFTLDGTVALELPHWVGPRLNGELRAEVAEMLWKNAQSTVCQKEETLEAEFGLQELLGGKKFVMKRMILPHTRSIDLEVHLDSTGQPIPVNITGNKVTASPENSLSKSSSPQDWERMNTGVTLSDAFIAQLTNSKKVTGPQTPSLACQSVLLPRVDPDEDAKLFNSELDLAHGITHALTKQSGLRCDNYRAPVKLAIQLSSRNHYCYHSQYLLGFHALKRRQLKLAGYRVVVLNYRDWLPLLRKSHAEKLAYLRKKVYGNLK
ncbi:FAST kinase domain-containing protein 5, mitochondrial [Thalassophryne amazonica]|uniref:FAST kinase domain-containing protein 5, mitochondrial n=1 Tax=Thalassophryne amazonica TaxID=390379 RepID=UPI001471CD29|nr:FAST kinase domain-containing protein 5, mitochondrial [Thalassophryne amazonica]